MTPKDFKELESVLSKFELYLGSKYSIIPRHHHDGCYLALYNEKGKMVRDLQGPNIETVSGLLRIQINQNQMNSDEFKHLEDLLGKLEIFLGGRYGIIPMGNDGRCFLGLYDFKGIIIHDITGPDIETAATLLQNHIKLETK